MSLGDVGGVLDIFLDGASPLFVLAVVIAVGVAAGDAARRVRLPAVTGQVIAGLFMGRAGLDLFGVDSLAELKPLTDVALGPIAITVGAHLDLRRLRNAGRRLGLSPLLLCLTLGFVQTNLTSARDRLVDSLFADFNYSLESD